MQRLTITIDDELVAEVDDFFAKRAYANRSEAFRDLLRSGLEHADGGEGVSQSTLMQKAFSFKHVGTHDLGYEPLALPLRRERPNPLRCLPSTTCVHPTHRREWHESVSPLFRLEP
jgi:hypothetical protein